MKISRAIAKLALRHTAVVDQAIQKGHQVYLASNSEFSWDFWDADTSPCQHTGKVKGRLWKVMDSTGATIRCGYVRMNYLAPVVVEVKLGKKSQTSNKLFVIEQYPLPFGGSWDSAAQRQLLEFLGDAQNHRELANRLADAQAEIDKAQAARAAREAV